MINNKIRVDILVSDLFDKHSNNLDILKDSIIQEVNEYLSFKMIQIYQDVKKHSIKHSDDEYRHLKLIIKEWMDYCISLDEMIPEHRYYDVWSLASFYSDGGDVDNKNKFLCKSKASSFQMACIKAMKEKDYTNLEYINYYRPQNNTYWGCGFSETNSVNRC